MGGVIKQAGSVVSSAVSVFGNRKAEKDYYKALARDANRQAEYVAAAGKRQAEYLFKSAAERSRDQYENYRQTLGNQQAALAFSGLNASSATVQTLLKNSRLNALLDEQALNTSLTDSLRENEIETNEKIRSLTETANQYKRAAKRSGAWWKWSNQLLSIFN